MANIDHAAFAEAVCIELRRQGLSFALAVEKWPELDKAMLSRACSEKALSAGNFLLVCKLIRLDPYRFLKRGKRRRVRLRDIVKRLQEQTVTQADKRETGEGNHA